MSEHSPGETGWLAAVDAETMRRIIDALYRVHQLLPAMTELDALLSRIMEESRRVAHAEASSLLLYDAPADELYFRVALGERGDQDRLKRDLRLKMGQGIAGQAALTRRTINVRDARNDTRFFQKADELSQIQTQALLAVPLTDRGALVGVLEVVNKAGGGIFSDADAHVLEMFSAAAATAITNARLIEENIRAERLAAIGEAMASLSHYTKNVVASMNVSAELIDEGLAQQKFDYLKRSWPIFKRSTKHISDFVEDMLAYSKARKPQRAACDIADLFRQVDESLQGLLAARGIAIQFDTSAVTVPVHIEGAAIHRCLLDLTSNAADAVPEQGGRIDLTARLSDNGVLELTVADNGPGVPDEHRHRIFEPFFSTKGSRGTGLGLAVVWKTVQEHSGTISVERGPAGGALFRIQIPYREDNIGKGEKET